MKGLAPKVATGLLERDGELVLVEAAFDRAVGGVGAVFVLEGAAGIGKSELLAALRGRGAARGFGVLAARGSEFEVDVAFGVARQLFEPMVQTASAAERRRLLGGVARVGAGALGLVGGEPPVDQFAAVHGLFWLCANRAERGPLVVVVDDVQWADDPSLGWLGYLARRTQDLPLVLIVSLRSGDPGGRRPELGQLIDEAGNERLALTPLSAAAVAAIVRRELDEDAGEPFCLACWELSGGNPLMVRELVAAAREVGVSARADGVPALRSIAPAAVASSVLARLRRLDAEAVALARALSVLGGGSEVIHAAALAGLDREAAELTADRLAAAQILAPVRPLEFFHPLIGAAVLADIAPGARRLAHRHAAELLDRDGAGMATRVAAHLLACGPAGDGWVVERLRDAAGEALDRGAPEVAASYVRRALAEPAPDAERAGLLLMLGIAERRAGQAGAIAHLEQALAAAGDDVSTMVAASFALAPAYAESDRAERAVDVLQRALGAPGARDPDLAVTLEAGIAIVGLMNERTAAIAGRRAEKLLARAAAITDPPAYVLVVLAYYAARTNRAVEAHELAERALRYEPYPPPREICIFLIVALTLIESYDRLRKLCNDLIADARRRGAMQELAAIFVFRASAYTDLGALADAEADTRWTLERTQGAHRMHAVSELIRVLIERDALEQADQELEQLEQSVNPRESRSDEVVRFLAARGRLRAAQGRLSDALHDFLECGQRSASLGRAMLSAVPWRAEAALIHATLGNAGEAARLAAEQLQLARDFGRPRTLGLSLRACGRIEGGDSGLELLAEAVRTLERSGSPLELARALTDHGSALRRARRRVQARAQLERALDLAHHCGAKRIAGSARAELIVLGAKPRRDAITGRDALTAAELRVARLAADGLTNREIAQALFITAKTAKVHLTRVYRKLEITHRGQLAGALSAAVETRLDDPNAAAAIA